MLEATIIKEGLLQTQNKTLPPNLNCFGVNKQPCYHLHHDMPKFIIKVLWLVKKKKKIKTDSGGILTLNLTMFNYSFKSATDRLSIQLSEIQNQQVKNLLNGLWIILTAPDYNDTEGNNLLKCYVSIWISECHVWCQIQYSITYK